MQPNRAAPKKGIKFLDTKVFIASLSVAVTVGIWNLFSHSALAESQGAVEAKTVPPPPPSDAAEGLPPLPTLIPLVNMTVPQVTTTNIAAQGQPAGQSPSLRSVTAPTQVIVQKVKPVFDQPAAVVSGGGGGGSPRAVTTTKSSR